MTTVDDCKAFLFTAADNGLYPFLLSGGGGYLTQGNLYRNKNTFFLLIKQAKNTVQNRTIICSPIEIGIIKLFQGS